MVGRRIGISLVLSVALVATSGGAALAGGNHGKHGQSGFKTSRPSMLTPTPGVEVTPLMTVGERLRGGYRFEAIPDGIAIDDNKRHTVDVYVNHETGKVPFPWDRAAPTEQNSENDFDNSQVSKLTLSRRTAGILSGSFAITSRLGYQRFCSNYLATWREGFNRKILLTNEETPDYVLRRENSWPPLPIGHPREKEAGLVVAYDVKSRKTREIHGMGRHNHENSVPVPGYGKPVVLSGDDTFTSGPITGVATTPDVPAQSQLYSYIAKNTNDLWKDRGHLWAFVSDTPGVKDYYDVPPGSNMEVTGHFIKVPRDIATGLNPDGSEIQAEDKGYPEPPSNGSWQLEPRSAPPLGVDGPQWVLQHWSDLNDVFQFVRVEDIAYDKRRGMGNVVYIADSGRGRTGTGPEAGQPFRSTNGRVWKMVLDEDNPKRVTSLSVFVEGDDNPVKTPNEIHQPDNMESTKNGLLVTEDPGSSQQYAFGPSGQLPSALDPNATTARLWHVPIAGEAGKWVVASVDQSQDGPAGGDVDGRPPGNWGAWESSGIVDASKAFGRGAFLIDVQAHTLWVDRAPGEDNFAPPGPDFTYKREGGQLLLIRIPGG